MLRLKIVCKVNGKDVLRGTYTLTILFSLERPRPTTMIFYGFIYLSHNANCLTKSNNDLLKSPVFAKFIRMRENTVADGFKR